MTYHGEERRKNSNNDHDTLIRVVEILETHVKNFDTHMVEDKKNFEFLNRTVWICMGAIFMLEIFMKITGK